MSFTTLLIANRGEIAVRVMRSAHEMGIRCVAVYVDADADAPFVAAADEAVRLSTSYLDGDAILAAAERTGAGAVHPGYGFLSENAGFARKVIASGVAWVGPSPEAIAGMGDKLAAKKLAQQVGVPILPGTESPREAERVGYPLLVKAVAGGGGKGMRIVHSAAGLDEAVISARREALSGFGDDRILLERYVPRARHIEIQILGDSHGGLLHLGERECSIQRRHQKIIEESPSPRLNAGMRQAMGEAALKLAGALRYESAGTVEFLLDDQTGEFFFLEVNTRLQVEHPVTELVTGIDIVRAQLRIARGEALGMTQQDIRFAGFAIEARLYAEDPANDFLPATGTLSAFYPATTPLVRWDTGIVAGSVIGTQFDPMLAKVIGFGPTRTEAAGRLALALERTHLGGVTTNRDFLAAMLRTPEFLAGDTTTDFIARVKPPRSRPLASGELERVARTTALWLQGCNRADSKVLSSAPSGWRNARLPDQQLSFKRADEQITVGYRSMRDGRFRFEADSYARIHDWNSDSIDVEIDGHRQRSRITRSGDLIIVHGARGDLELELQPRFVIPGGEDTAGGLAAPMPGKVIELLVKVGDRVEPGDRLVVLEAMKMEHAICAPESGIVSELRVALGEHVEGRAVLLVIDSSEPSDKTEKT